MHMLSSTVAFGLVLTLAACAGTTPAADRAAPGEAAATPAAQEGPSTVQAGAPGEASRTLSAAERAPTPRLPHTEADVHFMQNMIHHHVQALQMSRLVPERAGGDDIRLLSRRIDHSQVDEIKLMVRWLEARGEEVPDWEAALEPHAAHAGHDDHDMRDARAHDDRMHDQHRRHEDPHGGHLMAGMLTPEQLEELAAAEGEAFDRLFLEFMIFHHQGAIEMVTELFSMPGAAQDSDIFRFASHVEADQSIEIGRMRSMLRNR
jgi:uncharacterized protein (DUF305 family)